MQAQCTNETFTASGASQTDARAGERPIGQLPYQAAVVAAVLLILFSLWS